MHFFSPLPPRLPSPPFVSPFTLPIPLRVQLKAPHKAPPQKITCSSSCVGGGVKNLPVQAGGVVLGPPCFQLLLLRGTHSLRVCGGKEKGLPAHGEINAFFSQKTTPFGNFLHVEGRNLSPEAYHCVERRKDQYLKVPSVPPVGSPLTSFPLTLAVTILQTRITNDKNRHHQGLFEQIRRNECGEGKK